MKKDKPDLKLVKAEVINFPFHRVRKKRELPNLSSAKNLSMLKEMVMGELKEANLPLGNSWTVLSIEISNSNPELSNWLKKAVSEFTALKNRSNFTVR